MTPVPRPPDPAGTATSPVVVLEADGASETDGDVDAVGAETDEDGEEDGEEDGVAAGAVDVLVALQLTESLSALPP
jgi:hypothetical protein